MHEFYKTILHALCDRQALQTIWSQVLKTRQFPHTWNVKLITWLLDNLSCQRKGTNTQWTQHFAITLNLIWYRRNEKVFNNTNISPDSIVRRLAASISNLNRSFETQKRIDGPAHIPITSQVIKWIPPNPGVIKLNTDEAFCTRCSLAACGGVCRDEEGRFMLGLSNTISCCTSLMADIKAIYLGLSYAAQNHFNKLVMETDSWETIAVIQGSKECPHGCLDMLHDIKR